MGRLRIAREFQTVAAQYRVCTHGGGYVRDMHRFTLMVTATTPTDEADRFVASCGAAATP
jgi:hypothetical protein